MSTPSERPIDFCLHLAAAVRQGKKTIAYKPMPAASAARYLANKTAPEPAYGAIGDDLWMREPFALTASSVVYPAAVTTTKYNAQIPADFPRPILPAALMTRDQAVVVMALTGVAVVRLSDDLTEARALAAGMNPRDSRSCRDEFIAQWDEAYGKGLTVASNPPVWRLSFKLN
jgi:hypothetical protein